MKRNKRATRGTLKLTQRIDEDGATTWTFADGSQIVRPAGRKPQFFARVSGGAEAAFTSWPEAWRHIVGPMAG